MCDCACLSAVRTITFESKMGHLIFFNFEVWYSDSSWAVFNLPNPNPDSDDRFSESVHSVRQPESGFANPANPVLTWIH